jgi:hypothetical protein
MKLAFGKAMILGAAMAAASFAGCSSEHSRPNSSTVSNAKEGTGDLGLQLQVGDLTVNTVHYVLSENADAGTNVYTGDINVADASTLTAVIGGVVAGSYNLSLTATATDTTSTCTGGVNPVVVSANQTAVASVTLRCTKVRNKGSVLIDGTTNECPDITGVVGDAPNQCAITLHVTATDDGKPNPPGALSYTWSGFPGLTGANPTLNCDAAGVKNLTVTVSDSDTVCDETFGVSVVCPTGCPLVAPTCTDGIQNQGESDVDCGGANCPACVSGKHCNVGTDCATGLQCNGTTHLCETPPMCANNVPPVGPCGGTDPRCPACPDTTASLIAAKGTACQTCVTANCSNETTTLGCENIAGNATGGPSTGTAKSALCINLLKCELQSNCASVSAANCYCGLGGGADCFVGGSTNNGACIPQEQAGLESTAPATINSRYQTTSFGGGRANKIVNCMNLNGCTACLQ